MPVLPGGRLETGETLSEATDSKLEVPALVSERGLLRFREESRVLVVVARGDNTSALTCSRGSVRALFRRALFDVSLSIFFVTKPLSFRAHRSLTGAMTILQWHAKHQKQQYRIVSRAGVRCLIACVEGGFLCGSNSRGTRELPATDGWIHQQLHEAT